MRPIFRTPGRSSLDAIASFVGSYSVGLLVTNSLYKQGIYSFREASIIATGFSTVSVTFMVVIANTLNLMSIWTIYFIVSFVVTFAVTAITARIWPLRSMKDDYYPGAEPQIEELKKLGFLTRLQKGWSEGIETAATSNSFFKEAAKSLKDGLLMTMSILPQSCRLACLGLFSLHLPRFLTMPAIYFIQSLHSYNCLTQCLPQKPLLFQSLKSSYLLYSLSMQTSLPVLLLP